MPDLRLVIFDVDGTLIDSQAEIMAAMQLAFAAEGLPAPSRQKVLSIVGLSLPEAFAVLCPDGPQNTLVAGYKEAFNHLRGPSGQEGSPLFDGARAVLDHLQAQDETILAVATGKSKRGLDKMIARHGLEGMFISQQVADFHPSKPHPAMIEACLADAGVAPERAVMIGDTTYDIEMGRAAGVHTIGVSWGYHPVDHLRADHIVNSFDALPDVINTILGSPA